jgi:predicted TIM-barrel fold metal-dependent hydrolase
VILDANANVGPTVFDDFEFEPTLAALEASMDQYGIDEAVVAPLKPPAADFDAANARLTARTADHDRFHAIGRIDPLREESVTNAECALDEYGLGGLKLHPWEERYAITHSSVEPVIEVARERDVPVWIHAGYPNVSHALSIRDVAQAFPDIPFVLTHTNQLDVSGRSGSDALLLARETGNTYFELSGVYRRDLVETLVETIGPGRVLFGTNAPYFHPAVEKSRVTGSELDDDEKRAVLGESATRLL